MVNVQPGNEQRSRSDGISKHTESFWCWFKVGFETYPCPLLGFHDLCLLKCFVCLRSLFFGFALNVLVLVAFAIYPLDFLVVVNHRQHARYNTKNTHAKSNNRLISLRESDESRTT